MKIEVNRKYKTRDGRCVRILATDAKSEDPIVGLYTARDGEETPKLWLADGRYWGEGDHAYDIVSEWHEPLDVEMWAVTEPDRLFDPQTYMTKKGADAFAIYYPGARVCRVRVTEIPE